MKPKEVVEQEILGDGKKTRILPPGDGINSPQREKHEPDNSTERNTWQREGIPAPDHTQDPPAEPPTVLNGDTSPIEKRDDHLSAQGERGTIPIESSVPAASSTGYTPIDVNRSENQTDTDTISASGSGQGKQDYTMRDESDRQKRKHSRL